MHLGEGADFAAIGQIWIISMSFWQSKTSKMYPRLTQKLGGIAALADAAQSLGDKNTLWQSHDIKNVPLVHPEFTICFMHLAKSAYVFIE